MGVSMGKFVTISDNGSFVRVEDVVAVYYADSQKTSTVVLLRNGDYVITSKSPREIRLELIRSLYDNNT